MAENVVLFKGVRLDTLISFEPFREFLIADKNYIYSIVHVSYKHKRLLFPTTVNIKYHRY